MNATAVAVSTLQQTIARALAKFPRERARIERAATRASPANPSGPSTSCWSPRSGSAASTLASPSRRSGRLSRPIRSRWPTPGRSASVGPRSPRSRRETGHIM